jgi:hypothetical protein
MRLSFLSNKASSYIRNEYTLLYLFLTGRVFRRVSARKNLVGDYKKNKFLSGNNPPDEFKHLKMLNAASKCLKIL